ncbi:hydrolase 1, exosortase A system-associated [Alterisphingorhabdus coralli]|uniref:Hydrolase 1, exosortase A system-associated n=1 Tax=Alterisphingorhabdus coralli TaxID=3071408 RepID=A0AA97F4A1_9SPHN|nr:hydrolase 1, exosortase A system-associated [Parasphingorhabdus sp. SCSIO 66989]WOE73771.1 hydrolase 1, exosortase A system-associated [Parasphingorhabdus sp. SCSIO 66989]
MRRQLSFPCKGATLYATLDLPDSGEATTGLLLVSGGNEIRSGAHAGQAQLAAALTKAGYAVFRYDRRGVGDSSGDNQGFLSSEPDMAAALHCFREQVPSLAKIAGFGNCDAATALTLFHQRLGLDALILANPWTFENEQAEDDLPPPQAIRSRYLDRLKDPKALKRLVTGDVDLGKLAKGLKRASKGDPNLPAPFAQRLGAALAASAIPVTILLAEQDRTAQQFIAEWQGAAFAACHDHPDICMEGLASGSHSFADVAAKAWLERRILECLRAVS